MWGYVTVSTPDFYGGAAVTTENMYRVNGETAWTNVAGAATFTADVGDVIEFVAGCATNDSYNQPFGDKFTWTVPCKSNPTLEAKVIDDADDNDLTFTCVDPEDNTVIALGGSGVDIDNGDLMSIECTWQGAYEEDYGNRNCDSGNIVTIQYNQSQYTSWYITSLDGKKYPAATTPTLESVSTGYTVKSFEIPVLESNKQFKFFAVADATGSGKEPSSAHGQKNVTLTLYNVNWYTDNDGLTPEVKCGVEDEDGVATGSDTAEVGTIYIEA